MSKDDFRQLEFEMIPKKKKIFSVGELTKQIRLLLEGGFAQVWVCGEVSNFRRPSSGHFYFTLKDEASQLTSVMFRNANRNLKFDLEDGLEVICGGRISVYEKSGAYQLYVDEVEIKGKGALQLAFEQLKKRLSKEGLFDPKHKKPIPAFPSRVGVVTSATGAAFRDILNVLDRRFSSVDILINPVRVQGDEAPAEIARAIEEFNEYGDVDVLIVGRGGGSIEDLWAFNEEIVARAIFDSKIPVVSAVGHEIDWTISDFVSDLRAPTPSAAAELVVARKEELVQQVRSSVDRMKSTIEFRMDQYSQRIDSAVSSLGFNLNHLVEITEEKLKSFIGQLEALSPLKVLSRGYSVTYSGKDIALKNIKDVKEGDEVLTYLANGKFSSKVIEIKD